MATEVVPRRLDDLWLERCEGFSVEGPSGVIGTVDKVVRFAETDDPRYISVRAGRDGSLLLLVSLADVAAAFPSKNLVVLRRDY